MSESVAWLYLDMNSYFASVEQELHPELRGKPMAVVPLLADTTSCIAVSYEGKAFGVKTGTKVGDAKRLCPGIILVEGDHANYIRFHNRIVAAVESCIPVEAVCSIDEIACRLGGSQQQVEVARALAEKIKAVIRRDVGSSLRCSIGVAPNRYLAKIAADMNKPDGFTAIRPVDLPHILYALKPRDLPGIGARMEENLRRKGITSLEKIMSLGSDELRRAWGSIVGEKMWRLLRGHDIAEIATHAKSISHSHVLPPELRNPDDALRVVHKLTTKAAMRLRQDAFWASSIEVFARFLGKDGWHARSSLTETQDTLTFVHTVDQLWQKRPAGSPFAVGVVLSGLVPDAAHMPTLFDDPRRVKLTRALDRLNERFGKEMVHFGATHEAGELAPLRIAFTRIPDESEI